MVLNRAKKTYAKRQPRRLPTGTTSAVKKLANQVLENEVQNARQYIQSGLRKPMYSTAKPKRAYLQRAPVKKRSAHPLAIHAKFDASAPNSNSMHLNVPNAIGDMLPIKSIVRRPQTNKTDGTSIYIVYQFTNSNCQLFIIDGGSGVVTPLNTPQLNTAAPLSIRPLKATLDITNQSVYTSLSGVVRSLNSSSMFSWDWLPGGLLTLTTACRNSLNNLMNSHPSVKTMSASNYAQGMSFIIPPSSHIGFTEFVDWYNAATNLEIQNSLSLNDQTTAVTTYGPSKPVQNVLIIELESSAVANTYDITLHTQIAARFALDSLYSNLMVAPRPGQASVFDFQVKQLQKHTDPIPKQHMRDAHGSGAY